MTVCACLRLHVCLLYVHACMYACVCVYVCVCVCVMGACGLSILYLTGLRCSPKMGCFSGEISLKQDFPLGKSP